MLLKLKSKSISRTMDIRLVGFRMLISIFTAYWILQQCNGKIIREGDDFIGHFTLVESDQRIRKNCIRNITKNITLRECCKACLTEKKCQSFNRHREKGFCELLAISKFDETGLLQKDKDWVHYETDDDEKNVGRVCMHELPCKPYEICEDTLKSAPAYRCKCRDGFEGRKCQDYKGPGTESENPAASCELLLEKFNGVPDGDYWFKGKGKRERCERRVDGGLTEWSLFGPCNFTDGKCGTKRRNRSCTNPTPKGGGRSCDHMGHQQESEPCTNCTERCNYNLINSTALKLEQKLLGTFSKMLSEYRVKLELKVVNVNELKIATLYNVFIANEENGINVLEDISLWMFRLYDNKTFLGINAKPRQSSEAGFHAVHQERFDNKWIKIDISKRKRLDGNYVFKVHFNEDKVYSIKRKEAAEYKKVEFWMADFNEVINSGYVRNLYLEGFCDLKRQSNVN